MRVCVRVHNRKGNSNKHTKMGLKSGPGGAKNVIIERFTKAVKEVDSFADVLPNNDDESLVCIDGNVLIKSAPQTVATADEYINYLRSQIASKLKASKHVLVVLDNPAATTRAKTQEQERRDAKKAVPVPISSDLATSPETDEYEVSSLPNHVIARDLIMTRGAAPRMFDFLLFTVFQQLLKSLDTASQTLTFDGVDPRMDRPPEEPRRPKVISSHEDLLYETDLGEGDLKLSFAVDLVIGRRGKSGPWGQVTTVVQLTIDTDALVIEALQVARRACTGEADVNVLLALSERSTSKKRLTDGNPVAHTSWYTIVDVNVLTSQIGSFLNPLPEAVPSSQTTRRCVVLFGMAAALCGCDFVVAPHGIRFDTVLQVLKKTVYDQPGLLACVDGVHSVDDNELLRASVATRTIVKEVAKTMEKTPRSRRWAAGLLTAEDTLDTRVLWTVSYWSFQERKRVEDWGFELNSIVTSSDM